MEPEFRIIEKKYSPNDIHSTSFGVVLTEKSGLEHGTYVWDRVPGESELLEIKNSLIQSAFRGELGYFYLNEEEPYKNREFGGNGVEYGKNE